MGRDGGREGGIFASRQGRQAAEGTCASGFVVFICPIDVLAIAPGEYSGMQE